MKYHIQSKCNAAILNLLRLKNIRPYLTASACTTLVLGTVISHLDFVNSLFSCLPNCYVRKLQRIQNMAAKLILLKSRRDSATVCLKTLHWLPVHLRVEFKVPVLVFKCVTNQAPEYLVELLTPATSTRSLRSNSQGALLLKVPHVQCRTFAARAFDVYGPQLWNTLPPYIRQTQNVTIDILRKD